MVRICVVCGKMFDMSESPTENICKECWAARNSVSDMPITDLAEQVRFSGRWRNYCVCYVDIINATEITAKIRHEKISKYYGVFFNAMTTIAGNFHGKILKNLGDGLLLYFPETSDSAYRSAFEDFLECCVAMIDAHSIINKQLYAEELPGINYRISADYGKVEIAWSTVSQSDDLFGSTMNLCVKINSMAEPNGVVIGGDLYTILKYLSLDADSHFAQVGGYSLNLQHKYPVYSLTSKETNTLNPFKRTSRLEPIRMRSAIKSTGKLQSERQKPSYNIMLIDDEPDILFVFKELLATEGYNVEVFADPERALKQFMQVDPSYYDLVIADIKMPGINGLQLYQRLKSINTNIKVVFISAVEIADELISYLPDVKRGTLIKKPIDREKLLGLVKATLS